MIESLRENPPNPDILVEGVVDALDGLKAIDVQTLDVGELTSVADFMVIATGTSKRHVTALAERVIERIEEAGMRAQGVEGLDSSEWVLVDLGDVLVHVMQAETRDMYALEKLWSVGAGGRSQPVSQD
ncbi:MAG: ribosome silencing factor [Pseudomonadota bacterium]